MTHIEIQTYGGDEIHLSISEHIAHLAGLEALMGEAATIVYGATKEWFDTEGDQEWPLLAESTIERKASQGASEPFRILYAWGNLYESVTSPHGPYSSQTLLPDGIELAVNWESRGWQVASVLAKGNEHMPARPIWPPSYSTQGMAAMAAIGELFLRGLSPARRKYGRGYFKPGKP